MQVESLWHISIFLFAIAAGAVIAGFIPVPKAFRIPLGAFLFGMGMALALIAFS